MGQNIRNRATQTFFARYGKTMSCHFHSVLKAVIQLKGKYMKQLDGLQTLPEILNSSRFHPYFKVKLISYFKNITKYSFLFNIK